MAKIRSLSIEVFGKSTDFAVKYVAKHSYFAPELPPEMREYAEAKNLHGAFIRGKSEDEMVTNLRAFIKEYEAAEVKTRKVIMYNIDWVSRNIECHASNRWSRHRNTQDEVEIKFGYDVLVEKEVGGNKKYFEEVEPDHFNNTGLRPTNKDDGDGTIIEWTAEREAFMKSFYESVENLIRRLEKFVDTPELLLKTISKGVHLLEQKGA